MERSYNILVWFPKKKPHGTIRERYRGAFCLCWESGCCQ